jgi:hypothetical protein
VPRDPHSAPDAAAVEAARRAVEQAFIDAGTNFARVACPKCGPDLHDWWPEAMSEAADGDFRDLSVMTRCCARTTKIGDAVDRHLGTPTRIIWQHI